MPDPVTPTQEERNAYLLQQADFEGDADEGTEISVPKAEAKPAAKPEPAKPKHSAVLTRAALEVGLSEADIDDSSADDLRDYIRLQHARREATPARATERPAPQEPTPEPKKEPGLKLDWGADADEVIDPIVRERFDRAVAPLIAELARLRGIEGEVGTLKQYEVKRQHDRATRETDKLFAELGNDALYGTGGIADLAEDSPELKKRFAVYNLATSIVKAQGDKPNPKAAFKAAHAALFAGAVANAPAEQPKPKAGRDTTTGKFVKAEPEVEAWEAAATARPTNRVEAELPGTKAAKKAFEQGLAEIHSRNGAADTDDDEF